MSAPSGTLDEAQLAALSQRLGISARQLLIAAARLARTIPSAPPIPRTAIACSRTRATKAPAAESAARLLLTPVPDYAINEVDRAVRRHLAGSAARQDA